MKLKAALAKFQPMVDGGKDPEEVRAAIADPANKYSAEEVNEIFGALKPPQSNGRDSTNVGSSVAVPDLSSKPAVAPVVTSPGPVSATQEPSFNYDKLEGDEFKKYCQHLTSINGNTKKLFNVMKVEVLRKARYRGVKDSPIDIVGVRIKDAKPFMANTLIPVKHAVMHNGFVKEFPEDNAWELQGSQLADVGNRNMLFYFLAK